MITATLLALDSALKNYRHQEDSNFRGNTPNRFLIYRLNHSAMVPFDLAAHGSVPVPASERRAQKWRSYRDLNPARWIQSPES